jgi:hypothetical protein
MNDKPVSPQQTPERAAYLTPKLTRYGKLASLVQGGSFANSFEDGIYIFISVPV